MTPACLVVLTGRWEDNRASTAFGTMKPGRLRTASASAPTNRQASVGIAMWAYSQMEQAGGQVWVKGRVPKQLELGSQHFLAAV